MNPYSQESLVTGGDDHFLPKLIHEINQATLIDIAVSFIRHPPSPLIRTRGNSDYHFIEPPKSEPLRLP